MGTVWVAGLTGGEMGGLEGAQAGGRGGTASGRAGSFLAPLTSNQGDQTETGRPDTAPCGEGNNR